MHSISDLTTFCRKTTGDVPPKLVGASTTVVGSKMYLFGGRLVTERRMVSDLYVFDLHSLNWELLASSPEDEVPPARYFHSSNAWNNHLIIFGGMGSKPDSANPEDLIVLNDVRLFDITTQRWLPSSLSSPSSGSSPDLTPKARYAHLSSVTADQLFVIGGQDINNVWLDDVYIYDLTLNRWVLRRDYPRHCGTYRSVAVAAEQRVRHPQEEVQGHPSADLGPPGLRFTKEEARLPKDFTASESLVHLPYSTKPSDEYPNDIFLYSNYNFTDVRRELEVFTPQPTSDAGAGFAIRDRSTEMSGAALPPGLRFPTGAILGNHLIIAGTYLAHTYQSFSIWALDLLTNVWTRIDPGATLASGSWFRSCLWADANKFLIFGNRKGNLVEDYNRRLLSWDHVALVDLEAFGIYQPPKLALEVPMQELGLAALEEGVLSDFEIVCDDGRRIRCARRVLEERWPWFRTQLRLFVREAERVSDGLPGAASNLSAPALPGTVAASTSTPNLNGHVNGNGHTSGAGDDARLDPRLTPRSFQLSEPYPITLALLQYFYTLALITPLQHAPAVLSQLLVLSSTYELDHLQKLVIHAMHRALSNSTSVGVYEVATLCTCRSLQIRALKTVMAYNQRRPTNRSRRDADGSGGNRDADGGGSGGGSSGGGFTPGSGASGGGNQSLSSAARPRGMSNAYFARSGNTGSGGGRTVRDYQGDDGYAAEDIKPASPSQYGLPYAKSLQSAMGAMQIAPAPESTDAARPAKNHASRPSHARQKSSQRSITSLNAERDISSYAELLGQAGVNDAVDVSEHATAPATIVEEREDDVESALGPAHDTSIATAKILQSVIEPLQLRVDFTEDESTPEDSALHAAQPRPLSQLPFEEGLLALARGHGKLDRRVSSLAYPAEGEHGPEHDVANSTQLSMPPGSFESDILVLARSQPNAPATNAPVAPALSPKTMPMIRPSISIPGAGQPSSTELQMQPLRVSSGARSSSTSSAQHRVPTRVTSNVSLRHNVAAYHPDASFAPGAMSSDEDEYETLESASWQDRMPAAQAMARTRPSRPYDGSSDRQRLSAVDSLRSAVPSLSSSATASSTTSVSPVSPPHRLSNTAYSPIEAPRTPEDEIRHGSRWEHAQPSLHHQRLQKPSTIPEDRPLLEEQMASESTLHLPSSLYSFNPDSRPPSVVSITPCDVQSAWVIEEASRLPAPAEPPSPVADTRVRTKSASKWMRKSSAGTKGAGELTVDVNQAKSSPAKSPAKSPSLRTKTSYTGKAPSLAPSGSGPGKKSRSHANEVEKSMYGGIAMLL